MSLSIKKGLIGLAVETRSGMAVGKVVDLEIDPEQHLVLKYQVKTSRLLPGLFSRSLLIDREQVVAISSKKMIVEDSSVKEKEAVLRKATASLSTG